MKFLKWEQIGLLNTNATNISSRVSVVRVRARVSAGVRFRLLVLVGRCQNWLLYQY